MRRIRDRRGRSKSHVWYLLAVPSSTVCCSIWARYSEGCGFPSSSNRSLEPISFFFSLSARSSWIFVISSRAAWFFFIASPLPFCASFLMPDVFAGFLILGVAILVTGWTGLTRFERAVTSAIVLFAVLAHTSHFLALLGLAATATAYVLLFDRSRSLNLRWFIAIGTACVVIAVLWEVAFSFAVTRAFGSPPVRPPFVTAELVSLLGAPAVSNVCLSNAFVVCRFQDRLPIDDEAFLWSEDNRTGVFGVADPETKRAMEKEQLRFALAIVPPNLQACFVGVAHDALRQFAAIGLSEYFYRPSGIQFYSERLPSHYFERMTGTVAARSDVYAAFGRTILQASAILAAIFTAVLLIGVLPPGMLGRANEIARRKSWCTATCILLVGILLNAIICGAFSAVNSRYQARVIWLIQLCAVSGIGVMQPQLGKYFSFGSKAEQASAVKNG